MDGCSDPSKPSGDTICVLKASYGSYPVGGRGDLESDFGFVIYGTGMLAGLQAVTAKQIWRFEAAEKPSYLIDLHAPFGGGPGGLKDLTCAIPPVGMEDKVATPSKVSTFQVLDQALVTDSEVLVEVAQQILTTFLMKSLATEISASCRLALAEIARKTH